MRAWTPSTLLLLLAAGSISGLRPAGAADALGLRIPEGFAVSEFASDKHAHDIYTMTIDPKRRVVVAGRGYIRILEDDGTGRVGRVLPFADSPRDGAMGLLWEGDTLYATGDGGLRRFRDADGDGRADGPSELLRAMKTGGEHAAHAIRRGPDGYLYVLGGNFSGFDATFATGAGSPIRQPVGGCVLRFRPDFGACEIVADGFRNAYAMDFNPEGELFTFDSDNERCVGLPWYESIRFYHVIPGGHYGWLAPSRPHSGDSRRTTPTLFPRRSRSAVARRPGWPVTGTRGFRRSTAAGSLSRTGRLAGFGFCGSNSRVAATAPAPKFFCRPSASPASRRPRSPSTP